MLATAILAVVMCGHYLPDQDKQAKPQFYYDKELQKQYLPGKQLLGSFFSPENRVSIVQLISNPKPYHGKPVKLFGYMTADFEDTVVFMTRDDGLYFHTPHGVYYSFDNEILNHKDFYNLFHNRFVEIEGIFNWGGNPHMEAFAGYLKPIWLVKAAKPIKQ